MSNLIGFVGAYLIAGINCQDTVYVYDASFNDNIPLTDLNSFFNGTIVVDSIKLAFDFLTTYQTSNLDIIMLSDTNVDNEAFFINHLTGINVNINCWDPITLNVTSLGCIIYQNIDNFLFAIYDVPFYNRISISS